MGQKTHPIGFRLGVIRGWTSKWYSEKEYAKWLHEDLRLKRFVKEKLGHAGVASVEVERAANKVKINIYTARPGIVIGRGGSRVDEMRQNLEALIGKKVRLNIQEIRQPELDAYLVARSVAEQIERRVAYRRAMKQAIFRTIQSGAKGIKVSAAGRLANAEIARRQTLHEGQVPLHTLRADIDYGFTEAVTTMGRIGVKVWIYKGQVLPEIKVAEVEEKPVEAAAEPAAEVAVKPAEALAPATPVPVITKKPARVAVPVVEEKHAKAPKAATTSIVGEKLAEAAAKAAAAATAPKEKLAKAPKAAPAPAAEEKPAKPKAKKVIKTAEAKAPVAKKPVTITAKPEAAEETAVPAPKKKRKIAAASETAPKTAKKSDTTKNKEEGKDATA